MKRPTILLLNVAVVLAAGALACKTTEDTVVGKPPADEALESNRPRQITDNSPKAERPKYPEPALLAETWPYNDDRRTFELTWVGGSNPIILHERPDPNSPILGDVKWKNGEKIRWQGTLVAVYQPKVMRAKEDWFVEGPPYSTGYLTDVEFVQKTVKKGEPVNVWLYNGAGQCFLGDPDRIFTGTCPPRERFHGDFSGEVTAQWYQPAQKVWWVQIVGDLVTGWIPVDDRIAVDFVDQ